MKFNPFLKKEQLPNERVNWIDQVKGFTIFLVVYGHNFPFNEKYIYSFHMPLFIMIAGFFHPKVSDFTSIKKRFHSIIIPYFIWSLSLFGFWVLVGRNYGESAALNLSPLKNFIGVFYAQGDRYYMDWGIPLWFLPAIFNTFLLYYFIQKIVNPRLKLLVLVLVISLGFAYSHSFSINLPWSLNVAMVALFFYAFGNYFYQKIENLSLKQSVIIMLVMGLINVCLYNCNAKIDMYRAFYGNEGYYIINGISGSLMVLLFFKIFPVFRFLGFIGKFSLTILALQLMMMTFIKFILLKVLHQTDFNFTEWEKFLYAIIQILLLVPGFYIINKYLPIVNGGVKKI